MTALERSWFEEAQQSMHGWDFSHLAGRWPVSYTHLTLPTTERV